MLRTRRPSWPPSRIVATLALLLAGATAIAAPAGAQTVQRLLHDPFRADGGDPSLEGAARLALLGRTADPHDALAAALRALGDAADAATAGAAREMALAILEGRPLEGDYAFEGLPLLNWNAPAKVQTVPAEGTVTIRQIRFDGHVLTDTSRLQFESPDQPYTIVYEIAALGAQRGGHLAPTTLADGGTGEHQTLTRLSSAVHDTGTTAFSRFVPDGAPEETRLAVERHSVRMPPPGMTDLVLEPDRPGQGAGLATLARDTAARSAATAEALGFTGATPSVLERDAAIARLANVAPEKQLWLDLRAADPVTSLAQAKAVGSDDAMLVGVMRRRNALPPGVATESGADVTVALINGEAYVSREELRPAAGADVSIAVTNLDGFTRTVKTRALSDRRRAFGPDDWGGFAWQSPSAGEATLAPGAATTLRVPIDPDAFALVVGDDVRGDQSTAVIHLRRGPLRESRRVGPPGTLPLHMAFDGDGRAWATLAGVDKLVRLQPAAGQPLRAVASIEVLLPDGVHDLGTAMEPRWGPADVKVDPLGIVWVTLAVGNAIARIDPRLARDGSTDGVRIYELEPCTEAVCRAPPPPVPPGPLSREPGQMRVFQDGSGNAVVVFVEVLGDRIGILRVAPDGRLLGEMHVPCGCTSPAGIDLDPDGSIWFSESVDNRIGHLILDQSRPYSEASVTLRHHRIPSGNTPADCEFNPELLQGQEVCSSVPHSVELDPKGGVWFTESGTGKIGRLDPALATDETAMSGKQPSGGMREFDLPPNDFGRVPSPADLAIDRAGSVFWADEYGDALGEMTAEGIPKPPFRPAERQSLTDSPAITPDGDVWFIESAAELVSRLRGVSTGLPWPGPPPQLVADTVGRTLSGSGFRDVTAIVWSVSRGGVVIASGSGLPVVAGSFAVPAAVRAGDVIQVTPVGPGAYERLAFAVAVLDASDDGSAVTGTATLGGRALAGIVDLAGGHGQVSAPIDPVTGRFSTAEAGGATSITWAQGTTAGRFVTRAAVRDADVPPPPAQPAPTPAAPQVPPVSPAPPAPLAPPASLAPTAVAPTPLATPVARCSRSTWLVRRAVPLLGMSRRGVRACLGARAVTRRVRGRTLIRYPGLVEVTVRGGRSVALRLLSRRATSTPAGASLGRRLADWRRVLPGLRRSGTRRWTVPLTASGNRRARLVLRVAKRSPARVTAARTEVIGR